MVPKGWKMTRLSLLLSGGIKNGYSPVAADEETGYWVMGLGALGESGLIQNEIKPVEPTAKVKSCLLKAGDFLVSRSNTPRKVGLSIRFRGEISNCSYPDLMMRFRIDTSVADPDFIEHKLKSYSVKQYFQRSAAGSSSTMVKINKSILEATPVELPNIAEQQKIAKILSTWDEAIATTEQLLASSERQKKALIQQLLTGKKRLLGFEGGWKKRKISDFLLESRVSGSSGDEAKKLTVKLYGQGVVPKKELRQGSASTKYFKRRAGQFIYSKLDFLNGAFGVIPEELNGYESTLDLPAFDFLEGIDPLWFYSYISRREFYVSNLGLANGGRKARRVNPKDLLNISIRAPKFAEQKRIASVIRAANNETALLQGQLSTLKCEKKALMQELLTGKRRVKVDEEQLEAATA